MEVMYKLVNSRVPKASSATSSVCRDVGFEGGTRVGHLCMLRQAVPAKAKGQIFLRHPETWTGVEDTSGGEPMVVTGRDVTGNEGRERNGGAGLSWPACAHYGSARGGRGRMCKRDHMVSVVRGRRFWQQWSEQK